jgi:glutamate-1-semialdehyde 2,1-aminomutase
VYQAGTLSGNPLAMAAGCATLDTLARHEGAYSQLEAIGARLQAGLERAAGDAGVALAVARVGSVLTPFFRSTTPRDYAEARTSDTVMFARFHRAMLERGVLLPPSQFECWFVSLAHDEEAIDQTVAAAAEALLEVASAT